MKIKKLNENKIADRIKANQDVKGMTRRAIQTLKDRGGKYDDLADEYEKTYGEKVFKDKQLKEASGSDGWELGGYTINDVLDNIYNLQYEINNTVRGVYSSAYTYSDLANYIRNLATDLDDAADEIDDLDDDLDECLYEDTVKTKSGKWTNKGDTGETHGEFRTKKEADAQRRAIYANGWKGR